MVYDGHNAMTIARWPWASGPKNENCRKKQSSFFYILSFYNCMYFEKLLVWLYWGLTTL